ncbi:MAG TPA: hypothetical protein VJ001_15425 [Rhodocyclaceae bacterium]|nr:hypothetical protein [Rhodocyclaceae bacterium]
MAAFEHGDKICDTADSMAFRLQFHPCEQMKLAKNGCIEPVAIKRAVAVGEGIRIDFRRHFLPSSGTALPLGRAYAAETNRAPLVSTMARLMRRYARSTYFGFMRPP